MPSRKVLVIAVVPVLLGSTFLGKTMLLGGHPAASAAHAAAATPSPVPGEVLRLDPITINLAGGHYLRLGMALQLTDKGSAKELDGAKALDLAIATLSGHTTADVISTRGRDQAKAALTLALATAYDEKVMGVYFTDYVTQ